VAVTVRAVTLLLLMKTVTTFSVKVVGHFLHPNGRLSELVSLVVWWDVLRLASRCDCCQGLVDLFLQLSSGQQSPLFLIRREAFDEGPVRVH
jgi:hypothetical protein